jgi:CheY-like chemotaxis protein
MLRIIIAEDDEITRNLCVEYLTYKNLEVEAYENGEKVLEKMGAAKFMIKYLPIIL